ncbi:hypothetical protein QE152_g26188 [Popillia japonica]|uniref:Uncharacterized protein n=1 Tax=Popillia japonica TaxID=7064 RepID=A0AAW1JZM4_POPJA
MRKPQAAKLGIIAKNQIVLAKSHIRKVFDEETSGSEIGNYCEESDSLMEIESEDSKDFDWDLTNIQKGDFVLVKFATKKATGIKFFVGHFVLVKFATKKALKFFVGQIEDELGKSEFLVNFLKMTPRQEFVFPDLKGESHISANDIMRKLPAPETKIGTAISTSFFKFSVNFDGYNFF